MLDMDMFACCRLASPSPHLLHLKNAAWNKNDKAVLGTHPADSQRPIFPFSKKPEPDAFSEPKLPLLFIWISVAGIYTGLSFPPARGHGEFLPHRCLLRRRPDRPLYAFHPPAAHVITDFCVPAPSPSDPKTFALASPPTPLKRDSALCVSFLFL